MTKHPFATVDSLRQGIAEAITISVQEMQESIGQMVVTTSGECTGVVPEQRSLYDPASRTLVLLADRIPAGQEARAAAEEIARWHGKDAAQAMFGQGNDGRISDGKLKQTGITTDEYYAALAVGERPVFDNAVSGFVIDSHRDLGTYPRSYRHCVHALARSRGVELVDDEHVVPREQEMLNVTGTTINVTIQNGLLVMPDGQTIDLTKIQAALNHGFQKTGDIDQMEACAHMGVITGMGRGPSGEFVAREVVKSNFRGTRPPDKDGLYVLADGRFSRYLAGQWRISNGDPSKAGREILLDAFPSPQFRIKNHHRWSVIEGVSNYIDQANVSVQGAASKLHMALEKLVPHVLHYASMPHAHSDAHRDVADARREVAAFAKQEMPMQAVTGLSNLDDQVLVDELVRRGKLVNVWSADDFVDVFDEDEDVLDLELSDEVLEKVQQQAFEQSRRDLDDIVTARGNEHLGDWWALNKGPILEQLQKKTVDESPSPGM